MEFFSIKPEGFGLDISDSSLKIIKLKRRGRSFDLASFGEEKIGSEIVKEGEIKDEGALIKIVKEAVTKVRGERLGTKYLVASLPEQKTFSQVIQMPEMTEEELQSAILFEVENYIPLSMEKVYLDSQNILSPFQKKQGQAQEILIVASPRTTVDSYLSLLKKAGLQPLVFETQSMAICRALIKNEASEDILALVNLEKKKANLIIFSKNSIRFTSSISLPLGNKDPAGPAGLSEQIKKYIDYYQSRYSKRKRIKKILLSGDEANLRGVSGLLSERLKISAELGDPWINILAKGRKPKLSPEESLKYTTALGLALRAIKKA